MSLKECWDWCKNCCSPKKKAVVAEDNTRRPEVIAGSLNPPATAHMDRGADSGRRKSLRPSVNRIANYAHSTVGSTPLSDNVTPHQAAQAAQIEDNADNLPPPNSGPLKIIREYSVLSKEQSAKSAKNSSSASNDNPQSSPARPERHIDQSAAAAGSAVSMLPLTMPPANDAEPLQMPDQDGLVLQPALVRGETPSPVQSEPRHIDQSAAAEGSAGEMLPAATNAAQPQALLSPQAQTAALPNDIPSNSPLPFPAETRRAQPEIQQSRADSA